MTKRRKATYAYTTVNQSGYLNPYWVRSHAKVIREDKALWERARRAGWRIVKIKLVAVGEPR